MPTPQPAATALPTRISVEPKDPGFEAYGQLLRIGDVDVYLDGVKCKGVITADSAQGFVEIYDTSVEPEDVEDRPEYEWPTVVRHGRVTIESRTNPRTAPSRRATLLRLKGN